MIEVGRNSIVVRNVDLESKSFKNVNYHYSLYDGVYRKYTMSAFTVIDKDIYFPASIGVPEIQKFFAQKEVVVNYKTTAKSSPVSYQMKHGPRDELQEKAIAFLMTMKKDYDVRSRMLSLATGKGKTYTTINAIAKLNKRPMIVVDTSELALQWKREFINHTDLKDEDIVIISGEASVIKEIKSQNGKVYIAIHRTLTNLLSNDLNSINNLMNKLGIGVRVFDEAHVNFNNVCMINALSNVEYTIYLTATPGRSNYTDDFLYGKVMGRIPYFNGKNIEDDKYHTVLLYHFDSKPTIDEKFSVKSKYGFSSAKWAANLQGDSFEFLDEAIKDIFDRLKLVERDKKVAIMLPTLKLIEMVKQQFNDQGLEVGTFIGEVKANKRKDELDKKIILTNDKIFDKAIDVKDLEVLINFVPFASDVKTEQIMGRLRKNEGKSSIFIDVTDIGYDECVKQYKLRKRFYKKRAKKLIEIEKN
jgi:superfamily II DNA or RNA helicase